MPSARLRSEYDSFEGLMKRWKRAVEKAGTLQELRKREYFEKPSIKRKRAKAAAQKRWQRQVEMERSEREAQLAARKRGKRG